jgi:iron complex transport system substrate-binding protein
MKGVLQMKKIKLIALILALAAMVAMVAGCASNNSKDLQPEVTPTATPVATPTPTPDLKVIVKDSRGVELTFDKIPEKVVSIMPSNTEILYALGLGSKIIGVSEYCNYPEDTANKQKIPTGQNLNIESLIALKPDTIFIGKMSVMDDQIKQMEDAGIKIVVTEANNLSQTYEVMELIGTVMGKEGEAADLVDGMKKGFEEIKKSVEGKTPVSVYVEVSPLQYGLWSCGKNTFIQELIDIVGATNIFSDIEGWASVSEEQVLQRNPAIILTTSSPLTGIEDPVGEINSRANWNNIDAVKNNKVLMLDGDMITRPGPRLLNAAMELVKAVYPE